MHGDGALGGLNGRSLWLSGEKTKLTAEDAEVSPRSPRKTTSTLQSFEASPAFIIP